MIHDLDDQPGVASPARPAVRLCHLIIRECLEGGHAGIRMNGGCSYEGTEVLDVRYLVDGDWKDVMKVPAPAAVAVLQCLRSMCDGDPSQHPRREGTFRVRAGGVEASVTAHFTRGGDGVEQVEMRLTAHQG